MNPPKKKKKSFKELKEELRQRYNARKTFSWTGYADEKKEKPIYDLVITISKRLNFPPSYLYTIMIGEGLGEKYINLERNYNKNGILKTTKEMSGLIHFGVDDFGDDFSRVKKYLPKDYNEGDEFIQTLGKRPDDYGRKEVNTAIFKDLESGVEGFGAILAHRRDLFLKHAKQLAHKIPNEDQIGFWTYCYFQGEGRSHRYLKNLESLDYSTAHAKAMATTGDGMKEVRQLALERLASWRYIQIRGLFE